MRTWKEAERVTKEMIKRYLSPQNKLGIIMSHFSWDESDFCQEFLEHLLSFNKKSTNRWREKWLVDNIDWNDLGTQKSFRAWTKFEIKSFIGRKYYREITRVDSSDEKIDFFNTESNNDIELQDEDMITKLMNVESLKVIFKYMAESATKRELFIYKYMIGVQELEKNESGLRILNYPDGGTSKKTFYDHRDLLIQKLKKLIKENGGEV